MLRVAILALIAGLVLPLAACNKKKRDGGDGAPGSPQAGGDDLEALRAARPLPAFTAINLALDADVAVSIGSKPSVKVDAPDDLLPRIRAEVIGGQLELGLKEDENLAGLPKARFTVVAPRINSVKAAFGRVQLPKMTGDQLQLEAGVSGTISAADLTAKKLSLRLGPGGEATVAGKVESATVDANTTGTVTLKGTYQQLNAKLGGEAKLVLNATIPALSVAVAGSSSLKSNGEIGKGTLNIEGSGTVTISGKLGYLGAKLAGSGEMTASGTAATLVAEVTSGSKLAAQNLQAETVFITARNGTESTVWATKMLTAIVDTGGGTIRYKGNPKVDRRIGSAGGEVIPLGK